MQRPCYQNRYQKPPCEVAFLLVEPIRLIYFRLLSNRDFRTKSTYQAMIKLFPIEALILSISLGITSYAVLAEPSIAPFYESVTKMAPNGKLGQVIKKERIQTSVKDAQAWRIAYISSDVNDVQTISTALVVAPIGKRPAGGRPIMAWAHGTTGTAQSCGPSQVVDPAVPLNEYFLVNGNSWTDYGLPSVDKLIAEGYVVVGTDYQGLGGGGKHQYVVSSTQGRDVINSARAVASMKEAGAGNKAIVYGWSQGAGATIAAASSQDYIAKKGTVSDRIEFAGFVAMAPPDLAVTAGTKPLDQAAADKMLEGLVSGFTNTIFDFAHLTMTFWGTQAAYPNLRLSDILTEDGSKVLDQIFSNKCMHVASDTLNYAFANNFKALLKDKPTNTMEWANAFIKGGVPPVKPVAPVVVYWGTKDTTLPPMMGKLYQEQMCALGGNVERIQLPGEQTHFSTPGAAEEFYLPWIKDRLAGKPASNNCNIAGSLGS